ncbi:hypothetical protein [Phenylobacterium montanum]|uniref:Uncharacterized protein n=1 Tax=Phenylobacterium montanum TaxID=2823693 RepID=A0A975ITV3_9CAUL|nr:hypothetical protein [Caulobacter sp. S6]QUD86864.1 hypothetical protein KCG34_17545 [Caulobacter sp. S6]
MPAKAHPFLRATAVLLAALALIWPAAINGQPFFHPDTLGYVRGPDVAAMKLLGPRFASPWATLDPGAAVKAHQAGGAAAPGGHAYDDKEVLGGRSIYYGVLADLGARTGGFWLTVLVQALAVAWLVEIVLRGLGLVSLRAYAGVMAVLILASPAAFFASFLMPDVWAGVAIAALAALFALRGRLRLLDIAALSAMTVFAALAHTSVAPVLLVLMAGAGGLWLLDRRRSAPVLGLAVGSAAVAAAFAGGAAFTAMVEHTVGAPPVTPPFLTARVVADGPGTRFAQAGCGGQAFVVCRYAGRLPLDVDHFLWGQTDRDGVFQTASPADRRALGEEQARFALAAVRAYPMDQARASLANAIRQVGDSDISDFDYKPSLRQTFIQSLPAETVRAMAHSRAFAEAWPVEALWGLQTAVMGALVLAAAALMLRRPSGSGRERRALDFLALIVVGVLANAGVCGVLSSVNGRYEARVIWCAPLALAAWLMLRLQSRAEREAALGLAGSEA